MNRIRLQGMGWFNAISASELLVGDVIIHNFGDTSTIIKISKSNSGKSIFYTLRCESGKEWDRKTTPNRLFAVKRVNP